MSMEIELKAWVDNPEEVEARLRELFGEASEIYKDDIYYEAGEQFPLLRTIRLRRSGDEWILTYKDKRREGALEINREHETTVGSFEVLDELLRRFGCTFFLRKKKSGLKFTGRGLIVEFVEVAGLGRFLEIEKVVPEEEADAETARQEIMQIYRETGISESRLEARYYSDMLKEKGLTGSPELSMDLSSNLSPDLA